MDIKQIIHLENDITFQALNKQVNSFNPLKVLRLETHEIRHSNVLSWLFDPKENHQLDDYMLRKMLEYLLLIEDNENNELIEAITSLLDHSFVESHVFREVKTDKDRYIDLVVVNQQLKTVLLIENKVKAKESDQQLNDYYHYIHEKFNGYTIIPIYLTLNGETPSNDQYFIFSYEHIEHILRGIIKLHKEKLNKKTRFFIEDYRNLLKEWFDPNEEQMFQAIDIYRDHQQTINYLFEKISTVNHHLQLEFGYEFAFIAKYKNTIEYIFNHGKNIFSYSFEAFIKQQFKTDVMHKIHPSKPTLLPPEWDNIDSLPDFYLGKGLVVWFTRTNENRLKLVVEIGPIPYVNRLPLLEFLEKTGLPIQNRSKKEDSVYTRLFFIETDINKWDGIDNLDVVEDLAEAMKDLYISDSFTALRKNIASYLNNEEVEEIEKEIEDQEQVDSPDHTEDGLTKVKDDFVQWMEKMDIPKDRYRMTKRLTSFTIPLFDDWKEKLGETRENWWWDNGPLLFWMELREDSFQFVLEVGPVEATTRVAFMESLKEKGVIFSKRGLQLNSKYTRIFSKTVSYGHHIEQVFDELFSSEELQSILTILEEVYEETEFQ